MSQLDYLIVGGGLQGGLIALALRHRRPSARVMVLERNSRPGGSHTWAFHANDVPADAEPIVRPLLVAEWPAYTVAFPGFARTVPSRYAAISSARFADCLENSGCELLTNADVDFLDTRLIRLADGREFRARCVIDARGPAHAAVPDATGYQKFVGLEIETERPWPVTLPTVMDGTLPQDDGYRFMYALPFTENRVLLEETYFSDSPELNEPLIRNRIADYVAARNLGRWRTLRQEAGVLPMPWVGGGVAEPRKGPPVGPLQAGYAGGWFHPATGYSLPVALRLALAIAGVTPDAAHGAARVLARQILPRQRFARFLNRLLFTLVVPDQRWQVFRRLYRAVPDASLNRFYALNFGPLDATRLVVGWPPPVALSRLIRRPEPTVCLSPSPGMRP